MANCRLTRGLTVSYFYNCIDACLVTIAAPKRALKTQGQGKTRVSCCESSSPAECMSGTLFPPAPCLIIRLPLPAACVLWQLGPTRPQIILQNRPFALCRESHAPVYSLQGPPALTGAYLLCLVHSVQGGCAGADSAWREGHPCLSQEQSAAGLPYPSLSAGAVPQLRAQSPRGNSPQSGLFNSGLSVVHQCMRSCHSVDM